MFFWFCFFFKFFLPPTNAITFPLLPAAGLLPLGGWSFGEAVVPVPARQDPGGLADVSCLSSVRGPDKCRGRARGLVVSSAVQLGQPWGTLLPSSVGHARVAARWPWVLSDWSRSKICLGQRYGVVCWSPMAPQSHRQRSVPLGTSLAMPVARPYLPRPVGLSGSCRRGRSVPGFLQLFTLFPPIPPPLQFYQLH